MTYEQWSLADKNISFTTTRPTFAFILKPLSMKITLIDASDKHYSPKNYTQELASALESKGHKVKLIKTSQKQINYCNGCWSCWWKTPGECPQKDDMSEIYRSYLSSDLVVHFTPLSMGFINSTLKTINDRSIPLVHPYITIVNNECHHQKRYEKYPAFGLIVDSCDADEEDLEITRNLYDRFTLNLKSELKFFANTHQNIEEISHEISCI